jgi:hypothetical protein
MTGERVQRAEAAVDRVAAMVFAGALLFMVYRIGKLPTPQIWLAGFVAAFAGYVAAERILRSVRADRARFTLAEFGVADLPEVEPELEELVLTEMTELVLTDADRIKPEPEHSADELVLDDILAGIGPGARVVRLFDAAAMPSPGQLKSRIDRHLNEGKSSSPSHDDSQALHDALAKLRRSLS